MKFFILLRQINVPGVAGRQGETEHLDLLIYVADHIHKTPEGNDV